jgi:hypothetical protein
VVEDVGKTESYDLHAVKASSWGLVDTARLRLAAPQSLTVPDGGDVPLGDHPKATDDKHI